ncbi:hypothetical protein [Reyranella sp.]|uniref:hypothetical protein n=1 Tax=Reyranella sp. TaxID=1929291 RepID=UPI003BA9C6EC
MRLILAAVSWLLLSLVLATGTAAQNGLDRFEKEVKPQFELKSFTYAKAEPLGDAGFVLNDVVAVVPANEATGDKESTVKIEKVTVEALDFDRLKKDGDNTPRFAKLKLEGMTGDDELFTALQPYGVPRAPFDLTLDYALDPATKVLDVKTLEIGMRGQARLALSVVVDGISDIAEAKDDGRVRKADLTIDDKGLLARLVPAWAKEEKVEPKELVNTGLTLLAAFAAAQGPTTLKALDAVASFVGDWQDPKGPLLLGIKPAKTASLADLDKLALPDALTNDFGFTATYPGTRDGAAKAGAGAK